MCILHGKDGTIEKEAYKQGEIAIMQPKLEDHLST